MLNINFTKDAKKTINELKINEEALTSVILKNIDIDELTDEKEVVVVLETSIKTITLIGDKVDDKVIFYHIDAKTLKASTKQP